MDILIQLISLGSLLSSYRAGEGGAWEIELQTKVRENLTITELGGGPYKRLLLVESAY